MNYIPKNAPLIPDGWEYKGTDYQSKTPIRWAFWDGGDRWYGVSDKRLSPLVPIGGVHYITPVPKPAKKKPAPAKAKRAGKPVKALTYAQMVMRATGALEPYAKFPEVAAKAALAAIGIKA